MVNEALDKFFARMDELYLDVTFDDVLLQPGMSSVLPADVCLETRVTRNVPLNIPIVGADMDRVTESRLAIALAMEGGIGIIHRNMTIEAQADEVDDVKFRLNKLIETPICLRPDDTLGDLYAKMEEYDNRFSSFIITDVDGRLVGLVTRYETKYYDQKKDSGMPLKSIMVPNPFSIDRKVDVKEAYEIMKREKRSKLIITDNEGNVVGLYCWRDAKDIVENENPMFNRDERGQLRVGACIGVGEYERAERLLQKHVDIILVGTAHGHSEKVGNTVRELKKQFTRYNFDVLAGNVATEEGARYLAGCGADGVKVGLGPGSICKTRIVAGVGVPQVTAAYKSVKGIMAGAPDLPICADGGLRGSGDIAKALGTGAANVMCGSLLAGTNESPGEIIVIGDRRFKDYRGMGSISAMRDFAQSRDRYKQGSGKTVAEGEEGLVPLRGSVHEVVAELVGGIKSGFGYVGAADMAEFHAKAMFRRQTYAGKIESQPHDIKLISEIPDSGKERGE